MIIRRLSDIEGTHNHITTPSWNSVRMLVAKDEMGFGFHITTMRANTETEMHYLNHLECVYCINGKAKITDLKSGITHSIDPGTLYALNEHDRHIIMCETDLVIACVFLPALHGHEVHDATGSYPIMK